MKKLLSAIIIASTISTANAVSVIGHARPLPSGYVNYHNGYNNGYRNGFQHGKTHEKQKIARNLVISGIVIAGVAVIWNIANNRPVNQPIEHKVRF